MKRNIYILLHACSATGRCLHSCADTFRQPILWGRDSKPPRGSLFYGDETRNLFYWDETRKSITQPLLWALLHKRALLSLFYGDETRNGHQKRNQNGKPKGFRKIFEKRKCSQRNLPRSFKILITQQHTAPQCAILHHTAPHCTTLHHTAPHSTTLHHTAPHCTTLHHTAPHYTVVQ